MFYRRALAPPLFPFCPPPPGDPGNVTEYLYFRRFLQRGISAMYHLEITRDPFGPPLGPLWPPFGFPLTRPWFPLRLLFAPPPGDPGNVTEYCFLAQKLQCSLSAMYHLEIKRGPFWAPFGHRLGSLSTVIHSDPTVIHSDPKVIYSDPQ